VTGERHGRRLLGPAVADGFQTQHHSETAHIADEGVTLLEFAAASPHALAQCCRPLAATGGKASP
jgi:hypothetical protein